MSQPVNGRFYCPWVHFLFCHGSYLYLLSHDICSGKIEVSARVFLRTNEVFRGLSLIRKVCIHSMQKWVFS